MMHQGMDLSRFKRVASDKKTTTLRHVKGHEIKIAHSGLTPKMRAQIDALPEHEETKGRVKMAEGGTPEKPLDPISPEQVQPESEAPAAPDAEAAMPQPQPNQDAPVAAPTPITADQQQRAADMGVTAEWLRQHDAKWKYDLQNGHVEPQTYHDLFAKKDTLGKIGTLFGLMVSGAGAGLSHQPNAVMEMMNKEIANDLEGQKQSKGNALNYLNFNRQQLLDMANIQKMQQEGSLNEAQARKLKSDAEMQAYTLSRMQANRAALSSLVQQVNKMPLGSPQRQQAEQTLAMLSKGIDGENYNLADKAAAASALGNLAFGQGQGGENPEGAFQQGNTALRMSGNAPMAEDRESKHFPGLEGQASVPLSQGEREGINSGITFQKQLDKFMDWTKKHSGDLSPTERAYGQAMAAELQNAYRGAINGGVYKPSEQDFIEKIVDSTPTKFFNEIRVAPGLQAVKDTSKMQLNQLVKSKGFKGYNGEKKAAPKEGTSGTYNGKPVVFKGGKWTYANK